MAAVVHVVVEDCEGVGVESEADGGSVVQRERGDREVGGRVQLGAVTTWLFCFSA